jgi:DNA-binding HxlR family transcriptional regulator
MAAEIVCTRWTALILRELLSGSRRFNDLRRGVPRMSPTLLSKRLKELAKAGIIESRLRESEQAVEYFLTPAGEDLRDVVMRLGSWGYRWIEPQLSLQKLDPNLLMWDMRRNIDPTPLPAHRCTIHFRFPELAATKRAYWLVVEGQDVDLCYFDPGFEINLYIQSSLKSMTSIWMGASTVREEIDHGHLEIDGDPQLAGSIQTWLALSPFARDARQQANADRATAVSSMAE